MTFFPASLLERLGRSRKLKAYRQVRAEAEALSDEDLAAVLTYIRQSWGNQASEVTPEQVKAVRAEVGNRTQPWTVEQLNAVQ